MPPYAKSVAEQLDDYSPDLIGATFDHNSAHKQQQQVRYKLVGERNDDGDNALWDHPLVDRVPTVETATPKPKVQKPKQLPLMFQRLLDFNPCTDIKIASNPLSSALFKIRVCAECGEPVVHKLKGGRGYEKKVHVDSVVDEITGEESNVEHKVYFHSSCLQTKMDRTQHYEAGFAAVLVELQEVVKSKEEERKKREKEQEDLQRAAHLQALQQQQQEKTKAAAGRKKRLTKRVKRYLKVFSRRNKSTQEAPFRGVEV